MNEDSKPLKTFYVVINCISVRGKYVRPDNGGSYFLKGKADSEDNFLESALKFVEENIMDCDFINEGDGFEVKDQLDEGDSEENYKDIGPFDR